VGESGVQIRLDGPVGVLAIDRPERRNALDTAAFEALADGFRRLSDETVCRVIVIRGQGDAFCSGWDVAEFPEMSRLDEASLTARFERNAVLMAAIANSAKPTLAAVRGPCFGLGVGLAASADLAMASRSARFGLPELSHGLTPGMVMEATIRAIGTRRALGWTLDCRTRTADEAREAGLIGSVCEDETFEAEVERIAHHLASLSPSAVAAAKSLSRRIENSLADHQEAVSVSVLSLMALASRSAP